MSEQTQTLRRSEVIQWELEPRYTFVRPSWVGSSLDEAPALGIPLKIVGGFYDLAVAGDESSFVAISDGLNVISRPPVTFKKSGLLSAWESIAGWDDDAAIDRLLGMGYQVLNATGVDPVVAPTVATGSGLHLAEVATVASLPAGDDETSRRFVTSAKLFFEKGSSSWSAMEPRISSAADGDSGTTDGFPDEPQTSQLHWHRTNKRFYWWNGTAWE
jgi:hypothetical protein